MSDQRSPLVDAIITWCDGRAINLQQFRALCNEGFTAEDVARMEARHLPQQDSHLWDYCTNTSNTLLQEPA